MPFGLRRASAGSASVLVFGFAILVVYLVLSAQYESYVTPVIHP